jgi:hypothetical protein
MSEDILNRLNWIKVMLWVFYARRGSPRTFRKFVLSSPHVGSQTTQKHEKGSCWVSERTTTFFVTRWGSTYTKPIKVECLFIFLFYSVQPVVLESYAVIFLCNWYINSKLLCTTDFHNRTVIDVHRPPLFLCRTVEEHIKRTLQT